MSKKKQTFQDAEDLQALIAQAAKIRQESITEEKDPVYTLNFKKETIRLKFIMEVSSSIMDFEIGLPENSTESWTQHYPDDNYAVAMLYGATTRYDIPTKCMAVKRHLESGIEIYKLADALDVSQSAIATWKTKFHINYNDYIYSPEGTMIIAKEEKRVIGIENIKDVKNAAQHTKEIIKQIVLNLNSFENREVADKAMKQLEEISNSFITEE